jgi:hypothetical protein
MTPRLTLLLAALTASAALAQPQLKDPSKPEGLVVHEWGTFTSFSGPSGDLVPFNIALGEDLPDFVQARGIGEYWTSVRKIDTLKVSLTAEQRMETPVLYFYTDKPADVSVNVRMPSGLITEVYPPVTSTTPAKIESIAVPTAGSSIRWDHVGIRPSYCCDVITFPTGGDSHYFQARATKADPISISRGNELFGEKFLFYRGIARGDMGLKAHALGNDAFTIDKSESGTLSAVFAVEVAGAQVRFAQAENVEPGATLTLPKTTSNESSLGAAMAQSLEKAGLFQDEAQAMVNTWKHLWFGESGTRVMIIMPQASIDKVLPLDITPSPNQIKRVFVARLEMLTPERQQWAQEVLASRAGASDTQQQAIDLELRALGRFRDPIVTLAAKQATKPQPKAN